MTAKKKKPLGNTIALNKKAKHDYFIENKHEAGLTLTGWEVKSLRAGKCQLLDSYVIIKDGEAWLVGALINPLQTASTHIITNPRRDRKILLHKREIEKLEYQSQAKGYTCVCTAIYWKGHLVKAEIALAKGKQSHDKRASLKERDWKKQKERIMKHSVR